MSRIDVFVSSQRIIVTSLSMYPGWSCASKGECHQQGRPPKKSKHRLHSESSPAVATPRVLDRGQDMAEFTTAFLSASTALLRAGLAVSQQHRGGVRTGFKPIPILVPLPAGRQDEEPPLGSGSGSRWTCVSSAQTEQACSGDGRAEDWGFCRGGQGVCRGNSCGWRRPWSDLHRDAAGRALGSHQSEGNAV